MMEEMQKMHYTTWMVTGYMVENLKCNMLRVIGRVCLDIVLDKL